MVQCDMCGKDSEKLILTKIEGTEMEVCNVCSRLGTRVEKEKPFKKTFKKTFAKNISEEPEEQIVYNAGALIKQAREEKGMRQVDFAKMLQVKDSLLHHIEIGDMRLTLKLAKQIEEALGIKLVKKYKHAKKQEFEKISGGLTLGDLIKLKKK